MLSAKALHSLDSSTQPNPFVNIFVQAKYMLTIFDIMRQNSYRQSSLKFRRNVGKKSYIKTPRDKKKQFKALFFISRKKIRQSEWQPTRGHLHKNVLHKTLYCQLNITYSKLCLHICRTNQFFGLTLRLLYNFNCHCKVASCFILFHHLQLLRQDS